VSTQDFVVVAVAIVCFLVACVLIASGVGT
jgi:hypothetical protein